MASNGVQVVVRLRPLNEREMKHGTLPVISASTNDKTVTVLKQNKRSVFAFDDVFTAFSTQEEVFSTTLKPVIKDVLKGFESTVFAYGQTGTGKTHTMEGSLDHPDNYGVIPRAAESIFEVLNNPELGYESFQVFCSYLEIYNEELCDLLVESDNNIPGALSATPRSPKRGSTTFTHQKLEIMEGKNGPFCRGLSEKEVHSSSDLLDVMKMAQQQRKVGETNMNKQSSRSHCIFTLRVEAKRRLDDRALFETRGKLHMVDLAGSECAKTADMDDGGSQQAARERERMNINRSLLTLGRVVKLLKEQSNKKQSGNVRIPYRDSKLTRILQQALGGNSKTVIFATLSPSVTAIEESISTLNYAQAAHGIINKPVSSSYLSESTKHSSLLSGMELSSTGAQSLEHWKEMEVRLEYMKCQVEEAKAALARKHMQQQEFVERAEKAESEKAVIEDKLLLLTRKAESLEEQVAIAEAKCIDTEAQLHTTQDLLDKTTLLLQATQKTEANLTKEALALLDALKESVEDGGKLHRMLLVSREAEAERRRAAKQFNFSIAALLSDVKLALDALAQQEDSFNEQTTGLATTAASSEIIFLEKSKEILRAAVAKVENAVANLRSSIYEKGGIVLAADSVGKDAVASIGSSRSIVEKWEVVLGDQFMSTREKLTGLGQRLSELEKEHDESASETMCVLQANIEKSKCKVDELVASTSSTMNTALEEQKMIRQATKNTVELWKRSLIQSGNVVLTQSTTQRGKVENTVQMMTEEMQRHDNIENQLKTQGSLLSHSRSASVTKHEAQKALLLETQKKLEESHRQQTQLLSQFVQKLMKDVEGLVQKQVSEVVQEVKRGHSSYLESSSCLMENHANIASSTLETLTEAVALTSSVQHEAESAKHTDAKVIAHLEETKAVFSEIETTINAHQTDVETYSLQSIKHLQESEELEYRVSQLIDNLRTEGLECSDFISKEVLDETKTRVSSQTVAGKAIATFTVSDVLPSISSAMNAMEAPRTEMMSNFTNECSRLESCIVNGLEQIKDKASASCAIADELHRGLALTENEFNATTAEQHRKTITNTKNAFLALSADHAEFVKRSICRSGEGSAKAASSAEAFVKADLSCFEEVEAVPERRCIPYSDQLSSTPSEEVILKRVGRDASTVLRALSPNGGGKRASGGSKKAHLGSGGHALPNFTHERNEPRSETLA